MKAYILAAAAAFALAATPALACTQDEATAKAMEISQKMQELAAKDPQKAGEVAQKLSALQSQGVSDLAEACKVYDEVLAEIG